jgi:hypothetical protein
VSLADLNTAQNIAAPANVKPYSDLAKKLQATSGSGSSSSSSGSSAASGDYASCVQAAGTDVAKIQACGKLLGQ